jgi:hypothetical protein
MLLLGVGDPVKGATCTSNVDKYGHYEISGDAYVDCVPGPCEVRGSPGFDSCS